LIKKFVDSVCKTQKFFVPKAIVPVSSRKNFHKRCHATFITKLSQTHNLFIFPLLVPQYNISCFFSILKPALAVCLPKIVSQKIGLSSLSCFISEINFLEAVTYKKILGISEVKARNDEPPGLNAINQFIMGQKRS
jgi:hypothetical protein